MRQLIKGSNTLGINIAKPMDEMPKKIGKGIATTALIEYFELNEGFNKYYNAGKFEVKEDDQNGMNFGEVEGSNKSVNDIILSLLLLDNNMYMYIVSDYELKK